MSRTIRTTPADRRASLEQRRAARAARALRVQAEQDRRAAKRALRARRWADLERGVA